MCAIAVVVALALTAAATTAATSSPLAGDWSGQLKGVKPSTTLSFTVLASGHKRVVSTFLSSGSFNAPCAGALPTQVAAIPNATVNSAGKFKAVGSELTGFGQESWTVSGTFTGKQAAAGTVAIVLAVTPVKRCRFTVPWTAREQALAAPVAGATYKGKTIGGEAITFKVSGNGSQLASVTWKQPIIGGTCPGLGSEQPTYTGHNVPIHHSNFTFTIRSGRITGGTGETHTDSITGQFLAGQKAAGTVSTSADIAGFGNVCKGSDTWTAHR